MDMSFSTQALACAWMATQPTPLSAAVYDVPEDLENYVATLKLTAMGLSLEQLTEEQKKYLSAWEGGT